MIDWKICLTFKMHRCTVNDKAQEHMDTHLSPRSDSSFPRRLNKKQIVTFLFLVSSVFCKFDGIDLNPKQEISLAKLVWAVACTNIWVSA